MNPKSRGIYIIAAAFLLTCGSLFAQQKVYVLQMRDEVHASSARYISRGFAEAISEKADLIIIHLDTYGGRVDYADSIRSDILNSTIPTAVFIDRNAGSAGALISIACDSIYMAPGASIGAATVVDGNTGAAAPDKYQSYWRAVMRATAEVKGRDPKIAEKMVDEKLEIPDLSPAGQVITFTNQDAMAHGYSEGTKKNVQEVAAAFGFDKPQFVYYEGSQVDKAINFLINPTISAVLLILIFGGLFLEMKTPGFGFAGTIALIAIFLFFGPHYVNGLAESWEIAVFLLGIVLIALEIFVIPGFGVTGVLGIFFAVAGVAAALLENKGTSLEYVTIGDILRSVALVLVMLTTSILLVIWVAKHLVTSRAAYPFVDTAVQDKEDGYIAVNKKMFDLIGEEGDAITDLRPVGFVMIGEKQYDAEAKEGYISKGQRIVVERVNSVNLIVKKVTTA